MLTAAYALLGGLGVAEGGMYVGQKVLWQVDDSGKVFEDCTILQPQGSECACPVVLVHSKPEKVVEVTRSRYACQMEFGIAD